MSHVAPPVDEHSDLAADFETQLRQLASEFLRNHPIDGQPTPIQLFESADVAGLEPVCVAKDLNRCPFAARPSAPADISLPNQRSNGQSNGSRGSLQRAPIGK